MFFNNMEFLKPFKYKAFFRFIPALLALLTKKIIFTRETYIRLPFAYVCSSYKEVSKKAGMTENARMK